MSLIGRKVFIYWNLHRQCWSVRACAGRERGRVIAHAQEFQLENVSFKVSEAGRLRVIRERKKNVHAGVVGNISYIKKIDNVTGGSIQQPEVLDRYRYVGYNPYRGPDFIERVSQLPISSSSLAYGLNDRLLKVF